MAKKKAKDTPEGAESIICQNRKARHKYLLGDRFEAGLVLMGSEVKSCRAGKAHLNEAYVRLDRGEAFLSGAHIAEYPMAHRFGHEALRERKLLLHARELHKLAHASREKGQALVPTTLYFKGGRVKLEFAIATGQRQFDRRQVVQDREAKVDIARQLKAARR